MYNLTLKRTKLWLVQWPLTWHAISLVKPSPRAMQSFKSCDLPLSEVNGPLLTRPKHSPRAKQNKVLRGGQVQSVVKQTSQVFFHQTRKPKKIRVYCKGAPLVNILTPRTDFIGLTKKQFFYRVCINTTLILWAILIFDFLNFLLQLPDRLKMTI